MHHTAGADTGFSKRGCLQVRLVIRTARGAIRIRPGGGLEGGGGGGGDCTLQALYLPPYSICV